MTQLIRLFPYLPTEDKRLRQVERRGVGVRLVKELLSVASLAYDFVKETTGDPNRADEAASEILSLLLRLPYLTVPMPPSASNPGTKFEWWSHDPTALLFLYLLLNYGKNLRLDTNICDIVLESNTLINLEKMEKILERIKDLLEELLKIEARIPGRPDLVNLLGNAFSKLFNILKDEELVGIGFRELLMIPADTRPGLNNVSILAHLVSSSALIRPIANALIELGHKDIGPHEIAIAEIAAMVHDLGKLVDHRRHVEEGTRLLREMGLGVLAKYVEEHHSRSNSPVLRLVRLADVAASELDRLVNVVRPAVADVIGVNAAEKLYRGGEEAWRIHEELAKDPVKYLEINRAALKALLESKPSGDGSAYGGCSGPKPVKLCLVDIGGIQRFISQGSRLKYIIGASYIVRLVNEALIPMALRRAGIRVTNITILKGGNIQFVAWEDSVNRVKNELSSLSCLSELGLGPIVVECVDLAYVMKCDGDDRVMVRRIELVSNELRKRISASKARQALGLRLRYVFTGRDSIDSRCTVCGVRPAKEEKYGEKICDVCGTVQEIGDEYSITSKAKIVGIVDEGFKRDPMGYIVGEGFNKYALVRFDVNGVGAMLRSVRSFGEYVDISMLLDYAIKTTLGRWLNELGNMGGEWDKRGFLGLMYHGGDDAFLVVSPMAVPPLIRAILGNIDGWGLSVKVGIVVTDYKHPVSHAYAAAGKAEEHAKRSARGGGSAAAVIYMPSGVVTEDVAESVLTGSKDASATLNKLGMFVDAFMRDGSPNTGLVDWLVREFHRAARALPKEVNHMDYRYWVAAIRLELFNRLGRACSQTGDVDRCTAIRLLTDAADPEEPWLSAVVWLAKSLRRERHGE